MKRYLLFDHDGVLVDTEPWYYQAGAGPWPTLVTPSTRISTCGT